MIFPRRAVPSLVLWGLVTLAGLMLLAAYEWGPTVVHYVAAASEDPRPGARRRPTPDEMRRAQAGWRKRRDESPTIPQPASIPK